MVQEKYLIYKDLYENDTKPLPPVPARVVAFSSHESTNVPAAIVTDEEKRR
jgi:hypothetical protein